MPEPLAVTPATPQRSVLTTGGVLLAIGGLYFGREFFIPFTLAVLLAFALAPIVTGLRRLRLPRVAAVLMAVGFAFIIIGSLSYMVATQLIRLADALPGYQQTMLEKVRSIRTSTAADGGVMGRITSTIEGLTKEISGDAEASAARSRGEGGSAPRPVPVTIEPGPQSPIDVLRAVLGPLVAPLATAGIMVVFLIFILLEREDLRDRFIKLVGAGDLKTTTEALNEAAGRVSRYLLMQLVVNVSYGLPIGIGLYLVGVPNAVLWGVLATVLRFIPFLGPFLAALFPLALAFAVDSGWSMMFWVIGLFVVAELISNNVVEPWLYGASTGLSSLAIIGAAIFWTTLWGPIGLILSTPLTVCLIVMGRYVPQLNFLGVLLGSDPVLAPEEQLYQRLLAGNAEEAADIAETYVGQNSLREFYDQIAVPALRLAESDRQHGSTYGTHKQTVADGMISVVRDVAEHAERLRSAGKGLETPSDGPAQTRRAVGVPDLCIGGRSDLDCAAAEMVAQVMVERGIGTRVLPPIAISQGGIGQLDVAGIEVVCLTYLGPQPQTYARFVCRRLKRRAPHIKTIVCVLNPTAVLPAARDLAQEIGADAVVYSIEAAADQIDRWIAHPLLDPMQPAPVPDNEHLRLAALQGLGLTSGQGEHFDRLAAKVAAAFGTAIALVTVVDEKYQRWPGAFGLPPKLDACRMDARETSVCGHVVAANDVLVAEDILKDPRFANNAFLIDNGIRFYAGAPLRTATGLAIGSLCVIDTKPRSFSDADRSALQKLADEVMSRIEADARRQELGMPTSQPTAHRTTLSNEAS